MGLRFDRSIDLGHVATIVLTIATIGIPAFLGWLSQHDELQKHEGRLTVLESTFGSREQSEEAFHQEVRGRLDDILKQVNQLSVALVNKQDRR